LKTAQSNKQLHSFSFFLQLPVGMVFQSSILLPFAPCPLARVHGVRTLENFENVLDEFLEEHAEITYKGALDQSAGISKEAMKTKLPEHVL